MSYLIQSAQDWINHQERVNEGYDYESSYSRCDYCGNCEHNSLMVHSDAGTVCGFHFETVSVEDIVKRCAELGRELFEDELSDGVKDMTKAYNSYKY